MSYGSSYEGKDYAEEMFSEEEITRAIQDLSEYSRYYEVATLATGDNGAELAPEVIEAFAKLAKSLKLNVKIRYQSMVILREYPADELRRRAVERLKK